MTMIGSAGVLAFFAYRRKTPILCLAAALVGAVSCTGVLPWGFIALPILFGVWWRRSGKGYDWVLLASMLLSALVLYMRIPRPTAAPVRPIRDVLAVVRQVETAHQIWHDSEESGQGIRQPFQIIDLEFTPKAAAEPVHVLDRVDQDSVPGLSVGAMVPITYSISDPRIARISGASRTYAKEALIYILGLTYGLGAVVVFVVWLVIRLLDGIWAWFTGLRPAIAVDQVAANMSKLPDGDPRRKAFEAFFQARANNKSRSGNRSPG